MIPSGSNYCRRDKDKYKHFKRFCNFVIMIYPENFEEKIGFTTIRKLLKTHCLCSLGEENVEDITFYTDFYTITKLLEQVHEFQNIINIEGVFPSQDYMNLIPDLKRLRTEGTFFDPEQLYNLKISLRTIHEIILYIKGLDDEKYPRLKEIISDIFIPNEIFDRIDIIIDEKVRIRDDASKKLKQIRSDLISKRSQIEHKINSSIRAAQKAGWTQSDAEPTIRSGRLVIPVKASDKRKIKGFIHDESSSGQTVFIEPAEVFDVNNEIRDLENAEKREITKILLGFAQFIRPSINDIIRSYQFLGEIDLIRAKALFANSIEADKPKVSDDHLFQLFNAKHPLLYLSYKEQQKQIVPLDLELNQTRRILVISGPNAGGKSVCLMTIGLLQYMLQSGLLVPLNPDSEMGIFKKIFIDMGDEQSIENDLSTYSSHLLNIKQFLLNIDKHSLFLIDEFGSGTEPQLGGAIAEAVLEKLNKKNAFGIITTHYANLKLMADNNPGIINGAMLFDTRKLQPLFKLKTGKPGSSFAFQIAEKIGFPTGILKNAEKKTSSTQLDFEKQLQQLEVEKTELDKKKTEIKVADEFLSEMIDKYEKLKKELEESRNKIMNEAKAKAQDIMSDTNKLIENTIREIRESQAQKEKTKKLRKKIDKQKEKIESISSRDKKRKSAYKKISGPLQKGDKVIIRGQQRIGEILEIKNNQALISFDTFKMRTSINKLQKVNKDKSRQETERKRSSYSNIMYDLNKKMEDFKTTIDIRGKRAEEALSIVRNFIDNAIFLNIPEVSVIHGKGDGILRESIRDYLKTIEEVKRYRDDHPDKGGQGITIIEFS